MVILRRLEEIEHAFSPSPAFNMLGFNIFLALGSASFVAGQFCEHQWEGEFADHDVDGVPYMRVMETAAAPELEIRPLIVNGPSSNRVDLIFFGDGCALSHCSCGSARPNGVDRHRG